MTHLVTGGAGFIGSHLVERLINQGETVRVYDCADARQRDNLSRVRGQIEEIQGDIRDQDTVRKAVEGIEVVFHQAAISSVQRSIEDPQTTLDVNLTGTLNLLSAARDAGCRRVVLASSASVYGDATDLPISESTLPRPLSPYAISKLAAEQLCAVFTNVHGLETVALRYFNVFGPRQDPSSPYSGVIARFIDAARSGASVTIYGDGEQTRDFVYVENVVDANLLAASVEGVAGQVFNIGSGQATSLNDLLRTINFIAGTSISAVRQPELAGDIRHSVADISRAREALGYDVHVSIAEGLEQLLNASAPGNRRPVIPAS